MWQQMANQNGKTKTSVNEIVARHSPKISLIRKQGGCVKNNIGEWKLSRKALKFTWEISEASLLFLYYLVSINSNALATSISYKPTDSHSYLLFSSSHPNHTKQSIPYSQFLRLRRLCSDDKDFETKSSEMRSFFVQRGYPTHLLDTAVQRASSIPRSDTLKQRLESVSEDKIPLVLTFHPFNYKVRDIIRRNFHVLKNDPETSFIFSDNPSVSFRRNKNIRDSLVHCALRQNLSAPAGTFPCSWTRCKTCSFLNASTCISRPKSNFVIRHCFTCISSNLIYCISCSRCGLLYVGETGRRLSDRFAEHLRSVRNGDVDKPVARHFNSANHSLSDMKVCAFSQISGGNNSCKSVSSLKLGPFPLTDSMNVFLLPNPCVANVFALYGWA